MLKVEVDQPQGLGLWGLSHLPVGRAAIAWFELELLAGHDLVVIV